MGEPQTGYQSHTELEKENIFGFCLFIGFFKNTNSTSPIVLNLLTYVIIHVQRCHPARSKTHLSFHLLKDVWDKTWISTDPRTAPGKSHTKMRWYVLFLQEKRPQKMYPTQWNGLRVPLALLVQFMFSLFMCVQSSNVQVLDYHWDFPAVIEWYSLPTWRVSGLCTPEEFLCILNSLSSPWKDEDCQRTRPVCCLSLRKLLTTPYTLTSLYPSCVSLTTSLLSWLCECRCGSSSELQGH